MDINTLLPQKALNPEISFEVSMRLLDQFGVPVPGADFRTDAQNSVLLGAMFLFSLRRGARFSALEQTCIDNGIGSYMVEMPTPENSFKWAARNACAYINSINRCEIIKEETDSAKVTVSIQQRIYDPKSGPAWVQRSRCALVMTDSQGNLLVDPVFVAEVASDPIAGRVQSLYQWNQEFLLTEQIAPLRTNILKDCDAVQYMGGNTTFFVPAHAFPLVEALTKTLLKVGSHVGYVPIFRTQASEEFVQYAAQREAIDEVTVLFNDIEEWNQKMKDGGSLVNEATLNSRLEKLKEVEDKVRLYGTLLRKDADDLDHLFREVEDQIYATRVKRRKEARKRRS